MEVTAKNVSYFHDSLECIGHLSIPESSELLPLVLVAHTWKGRSEFEDQKVNALNALGYAALSIDIYGCLLYTSPSPRDATLSRMPSSA